MVCRSEAETTVIELVAEAAVRDVLPVFAVGGLQKVEPAGVFADRVGDGSKHLDALPVELLFEGVLRYGRSVRFSGLQGLNELQGLLVRKALEEATDGTELGFPVVQRHVEERTVGQAGQVVVDDLGVHGADVELAVVDRGLPDVLDAAPFHKFGEAEAFVEAAGGLVVLVHFLGVLQGVVDRAHEVGQLEVRLRDAQHTGDAHDLGHNGVVDVIAVQVVFENTERTDDGGNAGAVVDHVAERSLLDAGIVDGVVADDLGPDPAILVSFVLLSPFCRVAFIGDEPAVARKRAVQGALERDHIPERRTGRALDGAVVRILIEVMVVRDIVPDSIVVVALFEDGEFDTAFVARVQLELAVGTGEVQFAVQDGVRTGAGAVGGLVDGSDVVVEVHFVDVVDLVHVDAAVRGEVQVVAEEDDVAEGDVGLEDLRELTGLVLMHLVDLPAEALCRVRDLVVGDGVHHRFDSLLRQVQAFRLQSCLDDGDDSTDRVEPGANVDVVSAFRHGPTIALLTVADQSVDFLRASGRVGNADDGVRRLDLDRFFLFEDWHG